MDKEERFNVPFLDHDRLLVAPSFQAVAEVQTDCGVERTVKIKGQPSQRVLTVEWGAAEVISAIASLVRDSASRSDDPDRASDVELTKTEVGRLMDPEHRDTYLRVARTFFDSTYDPEALAPAD